MALNPLIDRDLEEIVTLDCEGCPDDHAHAVMFWMDGDSLSFDGRGVYHCEDVDCGCAVEVQIAPMSRGEAENLLREQRNPGKRLDMILVAAL